MVEALTAKEMRSLRYHYLMKARYAHTFEEWLVYTGKATALKKELKALGRG